VTPQSVSPGLITPAPMAHTEILPSSAMTSPVHPNIPVISLSWSQVPGSASAVADAPDGSLSVEGVPKTAGGEVRLQERLGGDVSYGTVRRWKLQPGKMNEALFLFRSQLLPLLSSTPGFVNVAILESGPDEFLSLGAWRDRASAQEATRHLMAFIQEHAADVVIGPPEMLDGEILLRRVDEATMEIRP